MSVPVFDQRAAADFFSETFELAQYYTPDWGLPDDVDDVTSGAVAQDFGLVLLELFSLLGQNLARVVNAIPVSTIVIRLAAPPGANSAPSPIIRQWEKARSTRSVTSPANVGAERPLCHKDCISQ